MHSKKSPEEIIRKMWSLFSTQNWEEAKALFHPDFTAYWPQSNETFVGATNFVGMNEAYPGNHKAEVKNLISNKNEVSCTAFISADTGQTAYGTSYATIKEGLIFNLTEYWGDEYPAPANREMWRQCPSNEEVT